MRVLHPIEKRLLAGGRRRGLGGDDGAHRDLLLALRLPDALLRHSQQRLLHDDALAPEWARMYPISAPPSMVVDRHAD